jgi:membrane protein
MRSLRRGGALLRSAAHGWALLPSALGIWLDANAFNQAGALAFYTLFSLAPVVIIAVAIIGLALGEQAAQGQIVGQLDDLMGREAALAVEQAVARSRIQQSGPLPTLLGVAALLLGATTVFAQMQHALNTLWGVVARPERSSLWMLLKARLLSLTVVLAIGFVLLVSLLLGVAVRALLQYTHLFVPAVAALLGGAELLVSWLAAALLFAAIYKVLPDVLLRWRDVAGGALVAALLFSVGRHAIATYLAYTATASTYGAAGSVVLILMWVYYSSLILLFGAAFAKAQWLASGRQVLPRRSAVRVRQQVEHDPAA